MSANLQSLVARLKASDPADAHEQREIFERIRELRSAFDGPLDPESHRYLEAAGMLVAYMARMGALCGEDVRTIAMRLLESAAEAEESARAPGPLRKPLLKLPRGSTAPIETPKPEAEGESRSATDLVGDMMLGQILLQRGYILEEHIHQAVKVQRATSLRIGDIFVKIGACSRPQLVEALNHQASIRRVRENLGEPLGAKTEPPDTRGTGLKLVGEAMVGEILIERGVITRTQLERALEVQKQTGARIGEALVRLGATTLDQIDQALRIQGRERRFAPKPGAGPDPGAREARR